MSGTTGKCRLIYIFGVALLGFLMLVLEGLWYQSSMQSMQLRNEELENQVRALQSSHEPAARAPAAITAGTLDGCPRSDAHLAVVIMMVSQPSSVNQVLGNLKSWKDPVHKPCTPDKQWISNNVELIFYYDEDHEDTKEVLKPIENALLEMQEEMQCFRSVSFMKALTTSTIDTKNSKSGYQFYDLYDLLKDRAEYFFIMEWDTVPVRANWVPKLFTETACGQDFYVKGSVNRNALDFEVVQYGWHINGNALYNSCSRDQRCYEWAMFCRADLYDNAYDYAMWWCYHDPRNVPTVKDIIHYYIYADFIQNQYHRIAWTPEEVAQKSPNTYLVHGQPLDEDLMKF